MGPFTKEHEAFRESVRRFVDTKMQPRVEEWEEKGGFDAHELFPELAALGALGLEYDPAYGGQGADHLYTVVLHEELGRLDAAGVAMATAVQTDMATPALHEFGSHELKKRYLEPALEGRMVCSIAVTEADAGSDVASIRTRAIRDGDNWVINGSKMYITNGTQADWLCLLARTSDEPGARGFTQIVVPTHTEGFRVSKKLDKLGMRSSDTAELVFDDVRVPVSNTIGAVGRGFHQQMAQFQNERMSAAYSRVGGLQQALTRTVEYLRGRQVFGAPLVDNAHVSYRLADLYARLDMLRHYNYACAAAYMRGEDTTKFASVAKLAIGELSRDVATTCLQFHGGAGYMEETWTARFLRDMALSSIGGGADEVMRQVITKLEQIHSVGGTRQ